MITLAHISTHDNIADCFTKQLPAGMRNHLFGAGNCSVAKSVVITACLRGDQVTVLR